MHIHTTATRRPRFEIESFTFIVVKYKIHWSIQSIIFILVNNNCFDPVEFLSNIEISSSLPISENPIWIRGVEIWVSEEWKEKFGSSIVDVLSYLPKSRQWEKTLKRNR